MITNDTQRLQEAFSAFLEAPTQQRQESLVAAAERYRDYWIETQAADRPVPSDAAAGGEPTTRYKRIYSVNRLQPDEPEVTLALQSRTSNREGHTWHVVSWRTRLTPSGHNRRFYVTSGHVWSINAAAALDMLTKLESLGGLDEKYFDLQRRPAFTVATSDDMNTSERSTLLREITMPDESWGEHPYFVVLNDPNEDWRKILLVDRETGSATFRSTTTDGTYMPRKTLRPDLAWYLDNSMQDTNVQQARVMLNELRRIVPQLPGPREGLQGTTP
ncbi:MAG: hypothetical protein V9E93_19520 [Steroidobacteraceae bacterium]|nr:hypothetical protein [Pseudomonadota bacterium]MBP6106742.1 hypothetical protein [Steroidobacteraceae bacterium]MBP7013155.1 hypothetical protein [Steroidobacteraceae bacterium]